MYCLKCGKYKYYYFFFGILTMWNIYLILLFIFYTTICSIGLRNNYKNFVLVWVSLINLQFITNTYLVLSLHEKFVCTITTKDVKEFSHNHKK